MKIHVIKVWTTLVGFILLLLTVLIAFKMCQLSAQGYPTFLNLSRLPFSKSHLKSFIIKTELKQNLATGSK